MKTKTVCVIVPAYNEKKVLSHTLESLLKSFRAEDVYVVNDGSSDDTENIAKEYSKNVLTLSTNTGKGHAINAAIRYFRLTKKYKYILLIDGDTLISSSYLKVTLPILDADKKEEIAAVIGRVKGRPHNWLTLYRIWEYEIAQTIHKVAQNKINAIIVCSGCSTIYRSKVFEQIKFPDGTLTEDMDYTFLIHRKKIGRIVYADKAIVITQDPKTIIDFIKQTNRWYIGFWQCTVKHNVPWQGQPLDMEVAILGLEGLFNGILILSFFILVPFAIRNNPTILFIPLLLDLCLFLLPTILYVQLKHKHWTIIFYLPYFYFIRILSSLIFLLSFFTVFLSLNSMMKWGKAARYRIS